MRKISRILSLIVVVATMAAIPASTQILSESGGDSSADGNLSLLILVNRLELSEEQMRSLHSIFTGLLEEKEGMDGLRAEFEDAMIEFNGTSEQLDELLVAFREDREALAEAMSESIETSLDDVRDLLSINQGIALREALPELLGGGSFLGPDRGVGQLQNPPGVMGRSMLSVPMGRGGMGQQAQRSGRMQSPMQGGMSMDDRSGSFDRDSMSSMMQERFSGNTVPEMFGERFGQGTDDRSIGTMLEQMQDRFEQFRDQVPEELRERLEDRLGGAIEDLHAHLDRNSGDSLSKMSGRAGNGMPEQGALGRLGERGNPFELLKQMVEVLELKLEAME